MKMKSLKIFVGVLAIVALVLIAGCTSQTETNTMPNLADNENLRVAEVDLPGMFCQACAQSSTNTFKGMPGVVDAEVNIKTKKGKVIYDSSVISKEELVQEALIQAYDGKILSDQGYSQE